MDRPHLRPSRFLTRTLPVLAALALGVYAVTTPTEQASASWVGRGCVTGKSFEPGRRFNDGFITTKKPDLNVVSVRFGDGSSMDFTSPGSITANSGDYVEAALSSNVSFQGELGEYFAVSRASEAVGSARLNQRAMLGAQGGDLPLTTRLDIVHPQGCRPEASNS